MVFTELPLEEQIKIIVQYLKGVVVEGEVDKFSINN